MIITAQAKAALISGLSHIDDFATLALNTENMLHNHSMIQTLAYLRADDWFYNDTIMAYASQIDQ